MISYNTYIYDIILHYMISYYDIISKIYDVIFNGMISLYDII